MPTNKLTDARCRSAKPREKDYKLFDGNGMFLFVSKTGDKRWRWTYRENGKAQTASLGGYPLLGLADARVKCDDLRRKLLDGISPKAKPKVAAKTTFWEDCEAFWAGRQDLSPDYRANALRGLELHLKPKLGNLPSREIDRAALLAPLMVMDAAGKYQFVRKVRMWASQVFEWAIQQNYATVNPAASIDPKKAFGRRKAKNHASLELTEVKAFMHRLSYERDLTSVLACKFIAYTWVRTSEMRFMTWDEVDGVVWRIPDDRMKKDKTHMVPLSRQALEILETMKLRSRGSNYVFAADHRIDRPISENTVLALLGRMGYKGEMTGHGWRSIASTWANEVGHEKDAIERQLAHSPEDKVRSAYNRAEYIRLRRPMMQRWADWLDDPDTSGLEG